MNGYLAPMLLVLAVLLLLVWSAALVVSLGRLAPTRDGWRKILADRHVTTLKLMRDVTHILDECGIESCLCGGSLLGAVRHGGFVPWDDDADFALLVPFQSRNQFEEKFATARVRLQMAPGLVVRQLHTHTQICRVGKGGTQQAQVDLFVLEQRSPGGEYHGNWLFRRFAPREFFQEDELWPLKQYSFEGCTFLGPKRATSFLNRAYPGCDREGRLQWPHAAHEWGPQVAPDWPRWKTWWAAAAGDWLFPQLRARYRLTPAELISFARVDDGLALQRCAGKQQQIRA